QIRRGLDATKLRTEIFEAMQAPKRGDAREAEAETNEVVST
ncbi:MAG: hypothetical protein QOF61_777, partial [Acidobacteriota bacterium]|nr:hypothetical protein [Acidobacteriota bacterium]